MAYKRGRYSVFIRPSLIVFDLVVINYFAHLCLNFRANKFYFFTRESLNNQSLLYVIYASLFWLLSSYILKFYNVYRYTSVLSILSLIIKQFFVFAIIVYAFIGFFRSISIPATTTLIYLAYCFGAIAIAKIVSFYTLKVYRALMKGNLRNVVIIGTGDSAIELQKWFNQEKELGYNLIGFFGDSDKSSFTGSIQDSFSFIENNKSIDEIYCAIDELQEEDVNKYVKFANMNHCNIKFLPNTSKFFTKRLKADYYNYFPVLDFQEVALDNEVNKAMKRTFDIVFSLLVIVFVLSWLSVILFVLIKLESKGPLFFKHRRNGLNYKEFICYKFRSLTITQEIKGTYVKPNDYRLTKIGKFLRRTNIDELPQFFNVLFGDMSVVGPRPHMPSYTEDYAKRIDKYNFIFRHNVKPGITGLAQIKGYRGEIESDKDIINRVKYDIFYIENWSLFLDLKIIVQTIINMIKGEEKAY